MKSAKFRLGLVALGVLMTMVLAACGGTATPTTVPALPTDTTSAGATATNTTVLTGTTGTATTVMTGTATTVMTGTTTGGGAPSGNIIKIGIDLPLSGGDASDGLPTLNGMTLAIDQANAAGGVTLNGVNYKLQAYPLDDVPPGGQAHDPAQGSKNADTFISDPDVMVVLGPFNSNVAQAMMPKLNTAGLCNISPSNTNETLTKPEYGQTGTYRPTGQVTYFRVCTTDDIQGPAMADYAYDKLNIKKIYILDDTEAYGKGIADNFQKEFTKKGGTVLGRVGVPKGTTDYSSILTAAAATNPDGIYYGGTSSNNIPLARKAMKAAGLNVPLLGGDGIKDKQYTDVAGADAEGSYATVAAVNVETLPAAKSFIDAYNAAGFKEPLGAYSGPGYDAANIAIAAIKAAGTKDRAAICAALRNTKNYQGVLGTTSFDANGDTTNKWISIYQVKNGAWSFVDQLQFGANTTTPTP